MTTYAFHDGQRVCLAGAFKLGEVTGMVPGDGKTPWYFVRWDDGSEDRYTADELEAN